MGVAMPRPRVPRRRALRDSGGPPRAAPGVGTAPPPAPPPPRRAGATRKPGKLESWEAVLDLERLTAAGRGGDHASSRKDK